MYWPFFYFVEKVKIKRITESKLKKIILVTLCKQNQSTAKKCPQNSLSVDIDTTDILLLHQTVPLKYLDFCSVLEKFRTTAMDARSS